MALIHVCSLSSMILAWRWSDSSERQDLRMRISTRCPMTIRNSQETMCGATSATPKRTGREKQALDELQLSTPVLCLCVVIFLLGWMAGLWSDIRTVPIAVIFGFVVLLIALLCTLEWLESRARIALADVAQRARAGSLNVEEIEACIKR